MKSKIVGILVFAALVVVVMIAVNKITFLKNLVNGTTAAS